MLNRIDTKAESARPTTLAQRHPWARSALQAVLVLAILAGALTAMNALIASRPVAPKRPPIPTVYAVETARIAAGDYRPSFSVYGEVVAGRTVDLRSLVAGEVVAISDSLKAGARVEKGEALVEIDRFDYQGAVRESQANLAEAMARIDELNAGIDTEQKMLARAEEQLTLAERDLQRMTALKSSGTTTDKEVEDRELILSQRRSAVEQSRISISAQKAKLAQQQAVADRLRWKVEQAERNLANTTLLAPFSGIVRSAAVEKGKMLNANDIAVSLYEGGNLEVRFTLTDERFARLQSDATGLVGRSIEVVWATRNAAATLPGRIDRLGADVAAERGGVEIFATLDAGQSNIPIRPGAFVEVRIPDQLFADHYRIPESAIYSGNTVYAVIDGRLKARKIAVSAYDGENALVTGDLKDGDEILTTRITEIGEGLRVSRSGEAADGASGDVAAGRRQRK